MIVTMSLFQIAAKTKAKETKVQSKENADPNAQKAPKPKKAKATKAKGKVYKFYTVFLNVGFTLKQLPRILLVHFSNYKGICKCIKSKMR